MYNEEGVAALQEIRAIVEALGPPILFRKMNGVFNAIEMQIEDYQYRQEVLEALGQALLETAIFYRLDARVSSRLQAAYASFLRKMEISKK
ncbi:MAG TPA: hypothetical protein VG013_29375 [Gemmataceae bacterium]|nr:hypothetical protein [Gemmataceae bacterium]